jgi:hypothetical protein
VGYFEAGKPKLLVTDPEMAKNILIKNFSSFHNNEFSRMVLIYSHTIFQEF